MEDIYLINEGVVEKSDLYTIRVGELVRDNVDNRLKTADEEIVKIREKKDFRGCIYYDEEKKSCRIYDHRPIQCVSLACWDVSEFMLVYKRPKANRRAIVHDKILLGLIDEHDRRCSYSMLEDCVKRIEKEGESAVKKILELLKFDYHIRLFTSKKTGINHQEMEFLFGRLLTETIDMFGLQVIRERDGSFFLTVLNSTSTP